MPVEPGAALTEKDGGQSVGALAQGAQALQLLQQLVKAVQVLIVPTGLYGVHDWTTGDLDIATAFPGLRSGTFSIKNAAAMQVFLPSFGGPWNIIDGSGTAAANHITVKPAGAMTIQGAASFVIATNWGGHLFILDGTNWL